MATHRMFPRFGRRRGSALGSGAGAPRKKLKILPLLIFAGFALFYVLSNQESVPLTGRTQIVSLSHEQETALGLQSYRAILQQSQVVSGGKSVELVQDVGERLASVVKEADFDWEFNLLHSQQANAFCLPGGKVAIFTGILPIAQTPDGLAIIMGHEIAHAVARHGAERISHQQLQSLGSVALGMSVNDMAPEKQRLIMGAFGLGSQFGIMLPYSRSHESEADYMGLLFAARACFDPREAPKVWTRMAQQGSSRMPEFLSTHPDPAQRAARFQEWMPEALKIRAAHCAGP